MIRKDPNGVVQISSFQNEYAANLLLRFSERSISDGNFAVLPSEGGSLTRLLQRLTTCVVSPLPHLLIIGETLIHKGVSICFLPRFHYLYIHVSIIILLR